MRTTIERCVSRALVLALAAAVGTTAAAPSSVPLHKVHPPGAHLQVRSAEADAHLKSLVDLVKSENAIALAARTPRRIGPSATPLARGVGKTTVGNAMMPISPNANPGIHSVNGKSQGYLVSPGVYLTIKGLGFGDVMGSANVIGEMPGGAAPLRVVDWRDDEVYSLLPPGLSGALDQTVFIQIITSAGKTWKFAGGRFVAERVTIDYTTNIDRILSFPRHDPRVTLDSNGLVARDVIGPRKTFKGFYPTVDEFQIAPLGNGFAIIAFGAACSRTDTGDTAADGGPGSRSFDGEYAFQPLSANPKWMRFSFGVWRNCEGKNCDTEEDLGTYQLDVTVAGPRGFLPF